MWSAGTSRRRSRCCHCRPAAAVRCRWPRWCRHDDERGVAVSFDLLVTGGTVVFPGRKPEPQSVGISGGRITALIAPGETVTDARNTVDATGLHVFPGIIDCHVHFGFAEPVTEYSTETHYAAMGGFTTIVGYFLSNESYRAVFQRELALAAPRAHVDFAFHCSVANETHLREMGDYVRDFGVTSFKYFMNFKGEEGRYLGLDGTDDGYFYDLLRAAVRLGDPLIVCHTENIEIVNRIRRRYQAEGKTSFRDWCESKPAITEAENLVRAIYFAEKTGARIYIPHVSSELALADYRRHRRDFEHCYLETCPHYLTHTMDMDLGSVYKANPPLRTRADVDALWAALADGTIHVLASDHVPRKRATKEKGIWQASQGFPGTATVLPVVLSEGYHKGRISLARIAEVLCREPARLFDLAPAKGDIRVGADGDLTLVDLDLSRKVDPAELGSHSDYSPYEGWTLKGWPVRTIVRGTTVMDRHKVVGAPGHGRYLHRTRSAAHAG
ncbi:MAG: dihydroorotase [Alphaproteobacteria bacterium]|nr:dihydroorotase [Alphaproteobacteria bacterium]